MTFQLPEHLVAYLKSLAREIQFGSSHLSPGMHGSDPRLTAIFGPWRDDCVPSALLPDWLGRLLASLSLGLERSHWAQFLDSVAWAGQEWNKLDEAAWSRVRLEFQCGAIEQALAFAATLQPEPPPHYWRSVAPAVQAVIAALNGEGDIQAAANRLECWSIPEGYDLWQQENATYEALWAAKCLADAAFGAGDPGEWTESCMAEEVGRADSTAMNALSRNLFQALANGISQAQWCTP